MADIDLDATISSGRMWPERSTERPIPVDSNLQERVLDVLCEDGADRASILGETRLASIIDSLKMIELVETLEDSVGRHIPDDQITEENFSSVSAICRMANRLSEGQA